MGVLGVFSPWFLHCVVGFGEVSAVVVGVEVESYLLNGFLETWMGWLVLGGS